MEGNKVEDLLDKPEESVHRVYDRIRADQLSGQVKKAAEYKKGVGRSKDREMAGSLDSQQRPINEARLAEIRRRMGW